mmetsp:Transcript_122274/g.356923  ORF Transcript_122274/g.356923 Transcript_122274/m.356923 type:complete len:110 (-) Transcript_122274:657-986(-)
MVVLQFSITPVRFCITQTGGIVLWSSPHPSIDPACDPADTLRNGPRSAATSGTLAAMGSTRMWLQVNGSCCCDASGCWQRLPSHLRAGSARCPGLGDRAGVEERERERL